MINERVILISLMLKVGLLTIYYFHQLSIQMSLVLPMMMSRNSCCEISPSWSLSNSAIMALNSSSLISSPSSLAT